MRDDCVLCGLPLDTETVEFGIFAAHTECASDWQRDVMDELQEHFDDLESQES